MARKIYYVPMVHTKKELGEIGEALIQQQEQCFGKVQTAAVFKEIQDYWKEVEKRLKNKTDLFNPEIACSLNIFVDGLPNGRDDLVQNTVNELIAKNEIPAYKIIGELKMCGATVHGTESLELIKREIVYWKALARHQCCRNTLFEKESLENRDREIITRISQVVGDEETAILFIGKAHNVVDRLAEPPYNFEVINL